MPRVYIANGHGIRDDGTFDPGATGEWTEQSGGDPIVRRAATVLRRAGVSVRDEAYADDRNFAGSTRRANAWPADLFVAVHHDWSQGVAAAFGFWWSTSAQGKRLALAILAAVERAGFPRAPGRDRARNLHVTRETAMPATLIEVGRIGQDSIDTDAERRRMGTAIAHGVLGYLDLDAPDPDPPDPPDPIHHPVAVIADRDSPDDVLAHALAHAIPDASHVARDPYVPTHHRIDRAILVGRVANVDGIAAALREQNGTAKVERIAGRNRYATARRVAARIANQ